AVMRMRSSAPHDRCRAISLALRGAPRSQTATRPIFPPQAKCYPSAHSHLWAPMPRFLVLSLTALLLALWTAPAALAQSKSGGPRIEWEVKNRFRLFRSEADFQRHVAADRGDGLLAAEDRLARESDGRGWARDTVERLCVDRAGKLLETCDRDGTQEDYLAPRDHRIGVVLAGTVPANTGCAWSLDDGGGAPHETMARCEDEVKLRVAYGRSMLASVDILLPDGTAQR